MTPISKMTLWLTGIILAIIGLAHLGDHNLPWHVSLAIGGGVTAAGWIGRSAGHAESEDEQ